MTPETSGLYRPLAEALGSKSTHSLWTHANECQLLGWERCGVDGKALMEAFSEYKTKPEQQTSYLDWMFLDAMMYFVIHELVDNYYDDVMKPGDVPNFVPNLRRAFATLEDSVKHAHPLLFEFKLGLQLAFFRWLPTLLLLALGIGCFFVGWVPCLLSHRRDDVDIGQGWPTAGWTILGLLAAWRAYRVIRWVFRLPLRRRCWRAISTLMDGYYLLDGSAVPTREVRHTVEKARDIFGRSAVLGAGFWSVLEYVCARYPGSMEVDRRP